MKHDKTASIVGRSEYVNLPDLDVKNVPAKVDTGADVSAIWATGIMEQDGVLSYVLFDRTSPFYTGKVHTTSQYRVTSIKNSFGQSEFRYKVPLRITIAGRTIRARLTLADRSNNRYPILIGRRTLHGKFVVDVAVDHTTDRPQRLLLMSAWISPNVANFVQGVMAAHGNLQITHAAYDDVQCSYTAAGARIELITTGEDIASYDMIHFKTSVERDVTASMARYALKRGVHVVDEAVRYFPASSKLYQYAILTDSDIRVPDTVFVMPARLGDSYDRFVRQLGTPFVLKSIHASRGADNYVITTQAQFAEIAQRMMDEKTYVVAQRYIPNDGDYRVLVFGHRITLIIYRQRGHNATHLNNTSQGGAASLATVEVLPTKVQHDCITAARVLERGIAGVDMVEDKVTGEWLCFEVNEGPQIATGAFVPDKQQAFAEFIKTELGK